MDTKEKTAEHWKLQARLILSDHMDYYESKGNSIIYMAEEDTLIKAMEAYAEQKLSALQARVKELEQQVSENKSWFTNYWNTTVKPLHDKFKSLEAENEELRKKINDDIDRELRDHGMKSLPSKPENNDK